MSDLMREEFEAWVKKRSLGSPAGFYPQLLFRCALDPDRYMISWVDSAFEGWQASRECLVITMPIAAAYPANEAASEDDYYFDQGQADGILKAVTLIHAAGVKTK